MLGKPKVRIFSSLRGGCSPDSHAAQPAAEDGGTTKGTINEVENIESNSRFMLLYRLSVLWLSSRSRQRIRNTASFGR